jgi:hypothetical protein
LNPDSEIVNYRDCEDNGPYAVPSALISLVDLFPGLTAGPIFCWRFAPRNRIGGL